MYSGLDLKSIIPKTFHNLEAVESYISPIHDLPSVILALILGKVALLG